MNYNTSTSLSDIWI